ncbi:MAG: hypothetical protein SGJ27_27595 [Candidatus Melainabacteria bacterium]|nr:hypothetical protein [Candidatus Melainabacteria bacterium]
MTPMDSAFGVLKVMLVAAGGHASNCIGPVQVGGEWLHIPHRIYRQDAFTHPANLLPEAQRAVVACISTRHYDGYVRDREVLKLLTVNEPWVVPFVVQLTGEYVVEIIQNMYANIGLVPVDCYIQFAAENPGFIDLTKKRAISYWDCYYRREYPQFGDYPGFQFLNAVGLWEPQNTRHLKFSTKPTI